MSFDAASYATLYKFISSAKDLTHRQKILYAWIFSLSKLTGYCHATNSMLGDLIYLLDDRNIRKEISVLKKKNWIRCEGDGRERKIFPLKFGIEGENNPPNISIKKSIVAENTPLLELSVKKSIEGQNNPGGEGQNDPGSRSPLSTSSFSPFVPPLSNPPLISPKSNSLLSPFIEDSSNHKQYRKTQRETGVSSILKDFGATELVQEQPWPKKVPTTPTASAQTSEIIKPANFVNLSPQMKKGAPPTPGSAAMVEDVKRLLNFPLPIGKSRYRIADEDHKWFYGYSPTIIKTATEAVSKRSHLGERIRNIPALLFETCALVVKKNKRE